MAQTRWSFSTGSSGDTLTAGNSGSDTVIATGGTAVLSSAQAIIGSLSALMTATTASGGVYLQKSVTTTAGLAVDMYVYLTTSPSGAVFPIAFFATSTRQVSLELLTDRKVQIRDSASAILWTSTASIPLNTWTRVALYAVQNASTGQVRAAIFNGHDTTPISGGDSGLLTGRNTGASAFNTVRVGAKPTTGTQTLTGHVGSWAYDPAAAGLTTPVTNTPPTASPAATAASVMKLTANASDSDGTVVGYLWEVTAAPGGAGAHSIVSATSATAYLVYTTPGSYTVRVTATDDGGASTAASLTVSAAGLTAVEQHTFIYNAATDSWV